jgi:TonB family protein
LRFQNLVSFDTAEDVQVESQIKKLYGLQALSLVTEAPLVWDKGKAEKAVHMFRLNGQDYQVLVTPGRLSDKTPFRIEVFEQGPVKKTSLLDTEFALPSESAAVFGFENTQGKPYFITLRIGNWGGVKGGVKGGIAGGVGGGVAGGVTQGLAGSDVPPPPPKPVKQVNPVYPEAARKARVQGAVILEGTIDTYGRVVEVKVLRSIPLLDQAATEALRQWVYEPMIVDGKPQPLTFTVTIVFRLEDKKPEVGGIAGAVAGGVSGGVPGGITGGVGGGVMAEPDLKEFEKDAVRAVGKIEPPKPVKQAQPVYPEVARKARVEGTVILEAKTDEKGNVVGVRVLRSVPLLDQAAIEAVKQWTYEPLVIDGRPSKVIFTVTVRFVLKDGGAAKAMEKFAAGAVKVEGETAPPVLVKLVNPVYPREARDARVQGEVILSVRTDESGRVIDALVLRSIPLLDQSAIDAVKQWTYEPLVIDGQPRQAVFTVTFSYVLK